MYVCIYTDDINYVNKTLSVCMYVCMHACLFSPKFPAVDFKPARVENPDKVLSETVACLKVLSACANHTSVQKGSANDIILSRFFHVEEMCQVRI